MSSIWALFAVVFLAIYTANLAAFMIPRKEYHDFSGDYVDDVDDADDYHHHDDYYNYDDAVDYDGDHHDDYDHNDLGIHDPRISNPMSVQPPIKFTTLPFRWSSCCICVFLHTI